LSLRTPGPKRAPGPNEVAVQVFLRQGRQVVRALPITAYQPTRAQAKANLMFALAARISRLLTVEEVAMLVGGQVVEVNGRKAIRMPDGRLLLKQMAFVKWFMEGYRTGLAKPKPEPLWLRQLEAKRELLRELEFKAAVHQGKPNLITSQTVTVK